MRRTGWILVAASLLGLPACKGCHKSARSTRDPAASAALPAGNGGRPPRPRTRADAAPPNLPRLHEQSAPPAHNHPARPRKHGVLDEYPCGSVWTGEEEIALECDEAADHDRYGTPAVALIPYTLLRAPRGDFPHTVDHRQDGFEGRTLAQGHAPSCTAFALTSQIDHALGLWTGQPGDVSAMQVWARYHNPTGGRTIAANVGRSVARDADWPYDQNAADAWSRCKSEESCLGAADQQRLTELDRKGVAFLEEVEQLPADDTLYDVIEAKLAAGRDVGVGGRLPRSFHPVGQPGAKYIADFSEYGKGAHAFAAVGYTHTGGERYFLIKNSWSERWGDGGYAWIHEATFKKIVHGGYVVVVDPVSDVGLRRHRRQRAQVAACAAGEAPDSVDGACRPICADGAPQHRGYCGVTEDCTRGFVNVAGECVLAAPKARGTEPKTGIGFVCAPGGCVYTLPSGVEGCKEARCQKSCPAPDFRLGRGKGGLLCLE